MKLQADKTVRLFEVESSNPLGPAIELSKKGQGFVVTGLALAPDGKTVATGISNMIGDGGQVQVWDATTGKHISKYVGPPYLGPVFRVSFSADGKTVSIVSGPAGGK